MKGDFSRDNFKSNKNYSSVRLQQGRVLLDADWNEQVDIQRHRQRQALRDIIGYAGGPEDRAGFKIEPNGSGKLRASAGHYYVYGIFCDNNEAVTIDDPSEEPFVRDGLYLAYLDVWERHITALDDEGIREIALGGPDTTTRTQVMNQIRLMKIDQNDCSTFDANDWVPDRHQSDGRLAAQTKPDLASAAPDKDCLLPPQAGYRGLENQLYRVEIHDSGPAGTATFKWSRENGSIVHRWTARQNNELSVITKSYDNKLSYKGGDLVEIVDEPREATGRTGFLHKLTAATADALTVDGTVTWNNIDEASGKIRRWEGTDKVENQWIELEYGLEVKFNAGYYQSGDYWLIPARAFVDHGDGLGLGDIIWPKDDNEKPVFKPRHGTAHAYAPLAVCKYTTGGWQVLTDCRTLFPPLTKTTTGGGCCLTVRPGDDIQTAVDQVIKHGGGSIALCAGVHTITGSLQLYGAQNLTIRGENEATRLMFKGDQGQGGIMLRSCQEVTVEKMLIVGQEVRALITTDPGDDLALNRRLMLRQLTLFNLPQKSTDYTCALHLTHAEDIAIESCRLAAQVGIASVLGPTLPALGVSAPQVARPLPIADLEKFRGLGVRGLRLNEVTIRYGMAGISALKSEAWLIADCDFRPWSKLVSKPGQPMSVESLGQAVEALFGQDSPAADRASAEFARRPKGKGAGIMALIWRDCIVRDSQIDGLATGVWIGGRAANNEARGLGTMWLHEAAWLRNNVADEGLVFGGSYRARLEGNRVQSQGVGLRNSSGQNLSQELAGYVDQLLPTMGLTPGAAAAEQSLNELFLLWLLLEELVELFGLTELRKAGQKVLDAILNQGQLPILFWLSQQIREKFRERLSRSGMLSPPVIALSVTGNDIEAQDAAISLADFVPLGGLRIADNRLSAMTGQALRIEARPWAAHVSLTMFFLRRLLESSSKTLTENLATMLPGSDQDAEFRQALDSFFRSVETYFSKWRRQVPRLSARELVVESNRLSSLDTAIKTNLWELIIRHNHITLHEQPITSQERLGVLDVLRSNDVLQPYAEAIQIGSTGAIERYSALLIEDKETLDTQRTALADDISKLGNRLGREEWQDKLSALNKVLSSGDQQQIQATWPVLTSILQQYVGSYGLVAHGAGHHILGNHILVPEDLPRENWPRGGLRLVSDMTLIAVMRLLYSAAGGASRPTTARDLSWLETETLIDNNEISGGLGHGIDIQGSLKTVELLVDLKIRANQIRNMGGQGILIDSGSVAAGKDRDDSVETIGVGIENNFITLCGNQAELAALTNSQGGLRIANAAYCRIVNNRIQHCGHSTVTKNGAEPTSALSLVNIYDLVIDDNEILQNLGGDAITLEGISGAVVLHSNHVVSGESRGLLWIILGDTDQVSTATASIQSNMFKMTSGAQYAIQLFSINGHRLKQLNLMGNSGAAETGSDSPYAFIDYVAKGMAMGNLGLRIESGNNTNLTTGLNQD